MNTVAERPKPRAKATQKTPTLGQSVDALWAKREAKRALEAQVKSIDVEIAAMEAELLDRLDAEGLDSVRGTTATISVGSSVVANVEDWDAFGTFIIKKKLLHLLQRRVSDPAYRELLEHGKTVPGVQPFNKKRLSVRSL